MTQSWRSCLAALKLSAVARSTSAILLTGTLLAACGGSAPVTPLATPGASASAAIPTPARATPQLCDGLPGARARWLPMADGGLLEANTAGAGAAAVVFLHEIGRMGMCGFAPYAAWLTRHYPVQVVLVNRCGYGTTQCPRAADATDIAAETEPAIAWARAHGARTVTLVGASGGGMDALDAAALVPGVSALVDISGDVNDTGANDSALARRVSVPALLAVAPGDQYCPLPAVRSLFAQIAAPAKKLLVETQSPGVHGWDLLFTSDGRPASLATAVAGWAVRAGS